MSNSQTTNQELRLRAFASHWGAPTSCTYKGKTIIGTVGEVCLQRIRMHGSQYNCQLILTRLSEIKFDDAKEIYKIIFSPLSTKDLVMYKQGEAIFIHSKYSDSGALSNGSLIVYPESLEIIYREDGKLENPDTYRALLIWDYLRSHGYDCGYGQDMPSLIDVGLAIEPTKENEI